MVHVHDSNGYPSEKIEPGDDGLMSAIIHECDVVGCPPAKMSFDGTKAEHCHDCSG